VKRPGTRAEPPEFRGPTICLWPCAAAPIWEFLLGPSRDAARAFIGEPTRNQTVFDQRHHPRPAPAARACGSLDIRPTTGLPGRPWAKSQVPVSHASPGVSGPPHMPRSSRGVCVTKARPLIRTPARRYRIGVGSPMAYAPARPAASRLRNTLSYSAGDGIWGWFLPTHLPRIPDCCPARALRNRGSFFLGSRPGRSPPYAETNERDRPFPCACLAANSPTFFSGVAGCLPPYAENPATTTVVRSRRTWLKLGIRARDGVVTRMRVWAAADRETIGRYCQLHELHARYMAECRAGGDRMVTKTGYEALTPAATLLTKLGASLLSIEKEHGLTPSARAHIAAPTLEEEEDGEALLLREFLKPGGKPTQLAEQLRARGAL
jgi:hypothetical protein